MSIQSQIDRINTNIANAYDAVDTMGGTLPVTQNSANLPNAIATLAQSDYIQLEWIESTGTQWINTGLNCTTIGRIQTSYRFSSLNSDWKAVMLGETAGNNDYPGLGILAKSSQHRFEYGTYNSSYTQASVSANTDYTVDIDGINNQITINNTTYTTSFDKTLPNTNLTLFVADGDTGGYYYGSGVRIYYCKLYNLSGELVRDYTPVIKKSDGEAGLYDNVSKTFFGNSGSGRFNTNNHDGYIQLEYIESTGMQYIDTGIYPNANTGIEADFAYVAITPNQQRLFGINSNISGYTEINISFYNNGSSPTKWAFSHNSGAIGNWTNTGVNADTNRHTVLYNKQNDGKLVIKTGTTTNYNSTMGGTIGITSQYTLPIFCELNGSQLIYKNFSQVRLYSFKIYDGNTLVRDYIPAMRNTDYEVGLYDQVNNIFYGNAGHGSFTPGIKIKGYSQLFWIKSTGAAWFDTGVSGGSKMEYSIVLNTLGARNKNYEQYFSGDAYPVSHKIYLNGTNGTSPVCAQQTSGNNWSGTSSNTLNIYTNADKKQTVAFESDGKLYVATLTVDGGVDLKGTGLNNGWGTLSYYVFNSHEENTLPSSMQLLHLKMKKDTDTVRFYIPMTRTSDNKYGVYDLVNNTFTPSATSTAFTASARVIIDDGTNSPAISIPLPVVVVPTPSTKSGSIANQIDRINENIANAYDVCRQIGRTLPYVQDSELLEPTILDTLSTAFTLYYYIDTTNHILYLRRTPKTGYTDGSQALNSTALSNIPWYQAQVTNIVIEEKIYTNSLNFWFSTFGAYGPIVSNINLLVTDAVTSMNYVVYNSGPNNGNNHLDLRNWNTSNVTNMSNMFWYTNGGLKSVDLSSFDTSNVTSMYRMFHSTMFTSLDLTSFNTTNVTTMESMFYNCTKLEYLDLSSFDMSNVSNTTNMFTNTNHVVTAYCKDAANKAILDQICEDCGVSWRFTVKWQSTYYRIDNGTLYLRTDNPGNYTDCSIILTSPGSTTIPWYENTSITTVNIETPIKPRRMSYWFWGLENVTNFVNLTNIITDLVTEMQGMFRGCSSLTSLDLSSFDTSNVYNMDNMFYNCSSLTSLDLSNFDTSKVKYMHSMFEDCSSLTSLDLSSFGTSNYITYLDMGWMFYGCSSLTSIDLSNFDMSGTIDTTSMFRGCNNVQTAYCRTQADKTILDQAVANAGYSWTFTIKS